MNSIAAGILKRIRVHGRGWVFTPRDFLDLGTRGAVDIVLWRLARDKTIRRLAQGVYDYPRIHKKLGILAPNPDDVAAVLAAKTGKRYSTRPPSPRAYHPRSSRRISGSVGRCIKSSSFVIFPASSSRAAHRYQKRLGLSSGFPKTSISSSTAINSASTLRTTPLTSKARSCATERSKD